MANSSSAIPMRWRDDGANESQSPTWIMISLAERWGEFLLCRWVATPFWKNFSPLSACWGKKSENGREKIPSKVSKKVCSNSRISKICILSALPLFLVLIYVCVCKNSIRPPTHFRLKSAQQRSQQNHQERNRNPDSINSNNNTQKSHIFPFHKNPVIILKTDSHLTMLFGASIAMFISCDMQHDDWKMV